MLSQMSDDEKVALFLIHFRLKSYFSALKSVIFKKRIIGMHKYKLKRLLLAWRKVTSSVKYYYSMAEELTLPERLRNRGENSFYDGESEENQSFAIGKANFLVKSWLKETKLQSKLRNIRQKGENRVKNECFSAIFRKVQMRKYENGGINQFTNRKLKGIFGKWEEVFRCFQRIKAKGEEIKRIREREKVYLSNVHKLRQMAGY